MVDWLLDSGIHILIAVVISGVLIFLIIRFEGKITDKLVPEILQDEIAINQDISQCNIDCSDIAVIICPRTLYRLQVRRGY